ncbi:uncharacterized protein LOC118647234 [Monomorium pharaonis]|uniref:uncharacterized protein LOC118647234 n=1 Tax=Monomorium pharaonis TaxID=307658 RepID=UPI001746C506|nr:uncharacterized protein LOC118647234 [Monomorium pharaonis]
MRVVQNRDCDRWCMKDQNNLAEMTEIFHHCQHSPLVFYGFWLLTERPPFRSSLYALFVCASILEQRYSMTVAFCSASSDDRSFFVFTRKPNMSKMTTVVASPSV